MEKLIVKYGLDNGILLMLVALKVVTEPVELTRLFFDLYKEDVAAGRDFDENNSAAGRQRRRAKYDHLMGGHSCLAL